jgi:zinc transport system substrate-binding protein
MNRTRFSCILLLTAACVGEAVDQAPTTDAAAGPLRVVAVHYPLVYMAERIGGDVVTVDLPMPDDMDPAFWQPTPDDIAAIQTADLILLNGANYAKWTATATLPVSRLVNTTQAVEARYVTVEGAVSHSHGPEGEHSHGEVAFTTWLDPTMAMAQARAVAEAFVAARPESSSLFEANLAELVADLEALDAQLAATFSHFPDRTFVGSHPVYQYLAARYGLEIASVHFEPDEEPAEDAWRDLRRVLADRPAGVMLWEGAPLTRTAERLAEMGLMVVVFQPAGGRPARGDYLDVMRANVANLREARPGVPTP